MKDSQVFLDNYEHSHDNTKANSPLLDVVQLSKSFGGIRALNEVSFSLEERTIISIIGPNGAGKTTFINIAKGIYAPDTGAIYFQGRNIAGLPAHKIAQLGIGGTFQLQELFTSMTVWENVMVGCHTGSRAGMFKTGFKLPSARAEEARIREEAMENLKKVGLEKRALDSVSSLPLGERKMLGIARALALKPKLLMLDEPAGGLATHELEELRKLIYSLRGKGLSLIIIEHNMPFVMSISERVIVFDYGLKIAEGPPEAIKTNTKVIKAYLGEED